MAFDSDYRCSGKGFLSGSGLAQLSQSTRIWVSTFVVPLRGYGLGNLLIQVCSRVIIGILEGHSVGPSM